MNLTQEECAEKLNISRQSLSSWENDRVMPDIQSVVTMCDFFQVSLDEMIRSDESYITRLREKEDSTSQINHLIQRISLLLLIIIWSFVIALYWIVGEADSVVYAIFALDGILGIAIVAVSFLRGTDKPAIWKMLFFSLFCGTIYYLAGFLTLDVRGRSELFLRLETAGNAFPALSYRAC